jgi:integral membrane protein
LLPRSNAAIRTLLHGTRRTVRGGGTGPEAPARQPEAEMSEAETGDTTSVSAGTPLVLGPVRMIRLLRKVAFWEATFFVILCVAWVVTLTGYKFAGPWHSALVVVGFSHGCVFTAYLLLVLLVRARMRWSVLTTLTILIAGLIPGGGYVVETKALSEARVELADVL